MKKIFSPIAAGIILSYCCCFTTLTTAQKLTPGPQVLTFFSDLDDSEQPYAIYIPQNYDDANKYPLVVMLHGAGSNHRLALRRVFGKSNIGGETDVEASRYFPEWRKVDFIVAAPFARGTAGYQGFVEKDVLDMLADVKKRFSVDENRTYLTGLSMGGGGTLWIGLSHPDIWAAIAPVCPAPPDGTDALAINTLNMAVRFFHGGDDPVVPASISQDWVKRLKENGTPVVEYDEYPGVGHDSWVGAYENGQIFKWFSKFTRNPYPERVRHASHDLEHGGAYWVRVNRKPSGVVSVIDAEFTGGNKINVKTQNVDAFTLSLSGHPKFVSDQAAHFDVSVDGTSLQIEKVMKGKSDQKDFEYAIEKTADGWKLAERLDSGGKKPGLEGPIADAFASRHIYVYGTADAPAPDVLRARIDTALKAAEWSDYRGEFLGRIKFFPRILADRDLRPSDYASSHLILFGTAETNSAIGAMADKLPMNMNIDYTTSYGLVFIYPNAHDRYVVINSGLAWWRSKDLSGWRFLPEPHMPLIEFPDFVLFRKDKTILAEGYFDSDWKITEEEKTRMLESGAVEMRE